MGNSKYQIYKLLVELRRCEDKVAYHSDLKANYLSKCIDLMEELAELGYDGGVNNENCNEG